MPVSARVLSTRHRLLAEVGDHGVAQLAASRVALDPQLSPQAAAVARTYLERAGVTVEGEGAAPAEDVVSAQVRGAHLALEHVARTVGQRAASPALEIEALLAVVRPADPPR